MNRILIAAGCVSGMLLGGCVSPEIQSGADAEVTHDGLYKVDHTHFDTVWVKPDIDLSAYSQVILQGVGISYRATNPRASSGLQSVQMRESEFPLDDSQKARLVEEVREAFTDALARSERFTQATDPGPEALLVRGALIDVVSFVPPDDRPMTEVYLTDVGEATLVLEVYDSESGEILARAVDRDAAGQDGMMINSNTVTNWVEVSRLAGRWASNLVRGMDSLADGTAFGE